VSFPYPKSRYNQSAAVGSLLAGSPDRRPDYFIHLIPALGFDVPAAIVYYRIEESAVPSLFQAG
jgi:hypothetical protein